MIILGIESTCDETGVAIVEWDPSQDSGLKVLANVIASSVELHKKYSGVVPEVAAREQVRVIIPVVNEALTRAFGSIRSNNSYKFGCQIDAIAVAHGPGLVGSLLIGVETAKTLAKTFSPESREGSPSTIAAPVSSQVDSIPKIIMGYNSKLT